MIKFFTNYEELKGMEISAGHIGNWIKKQIKDDIHFNNSEKEIMLEFPAVYIHVWINNGGDYSMYVGETTRSSERLREHLQSGQNNKKSLSIEVNGKIYYWHDEDDDWHSEWIEKIKEGRAFSWYFSSCEMNKSICLDLENSLFLLIKGQSNKGNVVLKTKVTEKQVAYSNKDKRDELLEAIWDTLYQFKKFEFEPYSEINKSCLTQVPTVSLPDELQFLYIKPDSLDTVISNIRSKCSNNNLLLKYPMVYLYIWKENDALRCYVGETDNLCSEDESKPCSRTEQHLKGEKKWEKDWTNSIGKTAYLLVFGHREFNKSMIREIENRMILYTQFLKCTVNRRHNEQGKYNNQKEMFKIYKMIIEKLLTWQKETEFTSEFCSLEEVQKNCIALASPFYELSEGQKQVKEQILNSINSVLSKDSTTCQKLIVLYGGAGTGKTMLLSSILFSMVDDETSRCDLVVNNKELAPTYQKMIEIWQLNTSGNTKLNRIVHYASDYFNLEKGHEVLLIDEGHLLFTEKYQGAKEQLPLILSKSRCTVLVFDPYQFIDQHKLWEGKYGFDSQENTKKSFEEYFKQIEPDLEVQVLNLDQQLRMKCSPEVYKWITGLSEIGHRIEKISGKECKVFSQKKLLTSEYENKKYEIAVYKSLASFYTDLCEIRKKDKYSICVATYDWPNDDDWHSAPGKERPCFYWHKTGKGENELDSKGELSSLSWVQQAKNEEQGSVHNIQGFDLSYAFVYIGPSFQYNPRRKIEGKWEQIEGIQVQGLNHYGNSKINLIQNELRILLTRGMNGVCIYAHNKNLRDALYEALSAVNSWGHRI